MPYAIVRAAHPADCEPMRRSVIVLLLVVFGGVVGLAVGFYYFGNDRPTYIRSTAPADQLVTDIGPCTAKELTLSYADAEKAAINGTADITLFVNNLSRNSRCQLDGFPTVTMTDALGNQLGETAGKSGPEKPEVISLAPNERAQLSVHLTNSTNTPGVICTNGIALLRVTLPQSDSFLSVDSRTPVWCPGFSNSQFTKS